MLLFFQTCHNHVPPIYVSHGTFKIKFMAVKRLRGLKRNSYYMSIGMTGHLLPIPQCAI
jgi:hypothetical protein